VLSAARAALPVVQKILPLLDGNIASVAASFIAPQQHAVDLESVKIAIAKLQTDLRIVRGQVSDQNTALKAVEEDLAVVKESIERNSLEQRELVEGLLNFKRRINRLAWMLLIMVIVSIAFTAMVCVRLAYLMRL
jgi:septal ring factor EnvC (AmiA/AmiB activator)